MWGVGERGCPHHDGDTLQRPQVGGRGEAPLWEHLGNTLGHGNMGTLSWGHPDGMGGQCQHGGRGTGNSQSMQSLKVTGHKDV